jgi:RNase P subunit RPR2
MITHPLHSEVHYLTQMNQAQWDEEELGEVVEKLNEHKPIKMAEPLKVEPFHHRDTRPAEQEREFCISCHTVLPHTKSERLRSYLNMHVNHLACISCHYQPEGVSLNYRWQHLQEGEIDQAANDKIIAPFQQRRMLTLTKQNPDIARLLESWEKDDIKHKAEDHIRLHKPIQSEGVDCQSCHTTKKSLLDFKQLGYDDEAITNLRENRIARYLSDESFKEKPIKLMELLQ